MEEAWELAVVSNPTFSDWTARHTRLRFQSVISSVLFFLVLIYDIQTVAVPGFVKLQHTPSNEKVAAGLLCFSIYSLIAFYYQHRLENRSLPISSASSKALPQKLADSFHWIGDDDNDFQGISDLMLPASKSTGVVNGTQAIGGGNNAHDFQTMCANLQGLRDDLVKETYLSDELIRIIPEKTSKTFSIHKSRKAYIADFDRLLSELQFISAAIETGRKVLTSRLLNIVRLLGDLSVENPIGEELVAGSTKEIESYLKDRKLHSELLPFIIPLSVAISFIIVGLLSWAKFYV